MKKLILIFGLIFSTLSAQDKVPNMRLKMINGKYAKLYDFLKDGPMIIDFWATWCEPCKKQMRYLDLFYNHFKPTKMVLVDPWKYETEHIYQKSWFGGSEMVFIGQSKQDKIYEDVKNMFKKEIDEKTIEIFRGNSDKFFKLNNVFFDLIYIDGNHLYDFIKKDLINSIKFINQNGLIVCDDYNSVGWWKNGVTIAVNEILTKNNIKLLNYKEALITQQAVLKKKS